jgi:hypothetical protein
MYFGTRPFSRSLADLSQFCVSAMPSSDEAKKSPQTLCRQGNPEEQKAEIVVVAS